MVIFQAMEEAFFFSFHSAAILLFIACLLEKCFTLKCFQTFDFFPNSPMNWTSIIQLDSEFFSQNQTWANFECWHIEKKLYWWIRFRYCTLKTNQCWYLSFFLKSDNIYFVYTKRFNGKIRIGIKKTNNRDFKEWITCKFYVDERIVPKGMIGFLMKLYNLLSFDYRLYLFSVTLARRIKYGFMFESLLERIFDIWTYIS